MKQKSIDKLRNFQLRKCVKNFKKLAIKLEKTAEEIETLRKLAKEQTELLLPLLRGPTKRK